MVERADPVQTEDDRVGNQVSESAEDENQRLSTSRRLKCILERGRGPQEFIAKL